MTDPKFLRAAALCGLALLLAALSSPAGAAPRVVVSIKPLHAIAAAVMEGAGEPELLLPGAAATPHGSSLRPSQVRMLARAEVVFWAGADLETFLEAPLGGLSGDTRVVSLVGALRRHRAGGGRAVLWTPRAPDIWPRGSRGKPAGPGEPADPHIWLDPVNGAALAHIMADVLAAAAPGQAALFRENARRFAGESERLEERLSKVLAPVRGRSFIVFHDSFQYLEHRFGLHAAGAVTRGAQMGPGAAHLAQLRRLLKSGEAVCVFVEPQFSPRLARTLVRGSSAKVGTLDPLGGEIPAGKGAYGKLLAGLADSLLSCLRG